MLNKTYTIGGTSKLDGVVTLRVANGELAVREAVLKYHGHTDISLQVLPSEMTKLQVQAWLSAQGINAIIPTKKTRAEFRALDAAMAVVTTAVEKTEAEQAVQQEAVAAAAAAVTEVTKPAKRSRKKAAAVVPEAIPEAVQEVQQAAEQPAAQQWDSDSYPIFCQQHISIDTAKFSANMQT